MIPEVAIACILSERWYAIRGFLAGLDGLFINKSQAPLFLISNSDDPVFNNFVVGHLSKQSWARVELIQTHLPVIHVGGGTFSRDNDDRFGSAVHCFNLATKLLVESGASYGYFIEDDVSVPPDTLCKHLAMFNSTHRIGATFAYAVQRWAIPKVTHHTPLVWDYRVDLPAAFHDENVIRFSDLPDGQSLPNLPYEVVVKFPSPCKWVEQVGSASTSSVMVCRDVLKALKWEVSYRGIKYYDANLGLKLKEMGYKGMIDWSLKVKHLHSNGEVLF